ncbi:MAG: alpha/beta family hydrolase [Solirubrobacteraceae bacterium]
MSEIETETPRGLARVHLTHPPGQTASAALVLGHGAGGGIGAPDLQAARRAATDVGLAVALVEQPYRVAGRRAPAPASHLDEAWVAVISRLTARELSGFSLICGGRSMGARVACRTAVLTGARGVLCLAFPLLPPARAGGRPPSSRLPELESVPVGVLVVQGERDRFGIPPPGPRRSVVVVTGDHALRGDLGAVGEAVQNWLQGILGGAKVA